MRLLVARIAACRVSGEGSSLSETPMCEGIGLRVEWFRVQGMGALGL